MNEISFFPTCAQEEGEILRDMKRSLVFLALFLIFFGVLPVLLKKGKKRKFLFLFWCHIFCMIGFLLLLFGVETLSKFRVYREDIYDPRLPVKTLKIFVFSDIHITHNPPPKYLEKHINRTIKQIEVEKPDAVIFAGDFTFHCRSGNYQTFPIIEDIFNRISNYPTFLIIGNHDRRCQATLKHILTKNKTKVLAGTTARIRKDNQTIHIHGAILEDDYNFPRNVKFFTKIDQNRKRMKYSILVAHIPDTLTVLQEKNLFDIAFLGHSHGGQVTFRNTIWSATKYANFIMCSGQKYHTLRNGNTIVHVSRGLGITYFPSPQVRIGVIPEVSVITIHNSK